MFYLRPVIGEPKATRRMKAKKSSSGKVDRNFVSIQLTSEAKESLKKRKRQWRHEQPSLINEETCLDSLKKNI